MLYCVYPPVSVGGVLLIFTPPLQKSMNAAFNVIAEYYTAEGSQGADGVGGGRNEQNEALKERDEGRKCRTAMRVADRCDVALNTVRWRKGRGWTGWSSATIPL